MAFGHEYAREQIEEAIKEGKWRDLPNKGQKLDLNEDPHVPPHLRLGYKILRDANAVPEWVAARQELEGAQRKVMRKREDVFLEGRSLQLAPREKFEAWRTKARADWEAAMKKFNAQVATFEWKAPRAASRPPMFRLADELKRFDQTFPPRP
jgi:hypothetical protein